MLIFGATVPFAAHCGIVGLSAEGGRTLLRCDAADALANNHGTAHGGLIATLVDFAMASAARTGSGFVVVTLDLSLTFLSPGTGTLWAEGRLVALADGIARCTARIRDDQDRTVAEGRGVFRVTSEPTPAW